MPNEVIDESIKRSINNPIMNTSQIEEYEINPRLREKFFNALQSKEYKRHFQVIYIFKNKIKRMYRIDCMTRKINVY
jgi:hypothetical protein